MSDPTPYEHSVELAPDAPSTAALWLLMLAGPLLWITHFMVVYLGTEVVCGAESTTGLTFMSQGALVVAVVIATIVATAAAAAAGAYSWRRSRRDRGDDAALARAGALLAVVSVMAILAVGLPALAFPPC